MKQARCVDQTVTTDALGPMGARDWHSCCNLHTKVQILVVGLKVLAPQLLGREHRKSLNITASGANDKLQRCLRTCPMAVRTYLYAHTPRRTHSHTIAKEHCVYIYIYI